MKRTLSAALALLAAVSVFTACGNSDTTADRKSTRLNSSHRT